MSDLGNKQVMAENIRYFMAINNKSRMDICHALRFSYTTFSDWVNGKKYPRIDKIELMANYFHISKADLVERRENGVQAQTISDSRISSMIELFRELDDSQIDRLLEFARMLKAYKGSVRDE